VKTIPIFVLLLDSTDGDSPILIRDRAILELLY
jgi:site-specific recombinase XerC